MACATFGLYNRQPLFEQRLVPRPEFEGFLTNQLCVKYEGRKCVQIDVRTYDMRDVDIRKELIHLLFICNIAGRRFRIDLARPGFIEQRQEGWVFQKKLKELEFISVVTQYKRLLNSNTVCAAQDSQFGKTLFLK
jgi:hypothetical protein